jgi:Cof subfamily protein (haloacid dehalogenase superfamily)
MCPALIEISMSIPFRLAAIDLDETLLGHDHSISARNARAVRALEERGVRCVIASGRMHEATTRFAKQLDLLGPIISYNGAMVKEAASGEVWHHVKVPSGPASEVIEYCAAHHFHLNYYLNDRLFVAERGEWADLYLRQTGSPMEAIGDLRDLRGTEPTKMILIDTPEETDTLLAHFRDRFGERLYITKTNAQYLEFMSPSASKGVALSLVAERLSIPQEEVIAFGDGHNDVPMIRWAGLGVAMGTGKSEAMAVADDIAPPFYEDGFGMYVEGLLGSPSD